MFLNRTVPGGSARKSRLFLSLGVAPLDHFSYHSFTPFSDEDISIVLKNVLDKYHREDGITWDTILSEIEGVAERKDDGILDFHF